jgi:hypothetical protein
MAAKIFLFDKLRGKYGYATLEECYVDRVNHRAEWFDEIAEFNRDDKTRLAREILKSNDVYVGMRRRAEVDACIEQKLFDAILWVDAGKRLPPESESSMELDFSVADLLIDNNGTESDLAETVDTTMLYLKIYRCLHD